MSTFQQALDSINSMSEYRATKPQFLKFSVTVASLVAQILHVEGSQRQKIYITFKNLNRVPGFNANLAIFDSKQSIDFTGIVAELAGIGAVHYRDGIWFYKLSNPDTRTTVAAPVIEDWVKVLESNPETSTLFPANKFEAGADFDE